MPLAQINNNEKKPLDASRFRRLYNVRHAWGDVHSFVMSLPGLVGYWPGAINRATPLLSDVSGNGLHLTLNGNAAVVDHFSISISFAPFLTFDGTNDYFSHVDNAKLDITGTESIIDPSIQGLTMMCWIDPDNANGQIMGKWGAASNNSYRLFLNSGDILMQVTGDGSTTVEQGYSSSIISAVGQWYFVAGVFSNANNLIYIYLDGREPNTESFTSTVFNGTSQFTIGADSVAGSDYDGNVAKPILCACALPQVVINTYYQMTAPLYQKRV